MIPRVCYITDGKRGTGGRRQADVIEAAFRGGLRMLIVRLRQASGERWSELLEPILPLRDRGLRVLASRRLDVARAFDLDGVHLAADSVSVRQARAWLGADALVGYSAHDAEEARRVAREGASYVTLSPIYPTESKPGARGRGCVWLEEATRGLEIPALALGGITPDRTAETHSAGAWGVAAVSAIGAAVEPEAAVRAFEKALTEDRR